VICGVAAPFHIRVRAFVLSDRLVHVAEGGASWSQIPESARSPTPSLHSHHVPGTELIYERLERWIPRWGGGDGGDGVKLGGKVVREDGNEGKQAEMSTHTYHTHIHTLQSGNLLAQLSCPNSVPLLSSLTWVCGSANLLAPPRSCGDTRQIPLACID